MRGKIIVIEGIDCSGKETQSKLLAKKLNDMGKKTVHFSFPMYDTPTGKIVGGPYLGKKDIGPCWFEEGSVQVDPTISCLYYAADRKYNIDKIERELEAGNYVILDRYTSSNMAHQGSKIKDSDERFNMFQWIDKLEYWLLGLPKPDQTIFLHVPTDYSQKLKCKRQDEQMDDENEKDADYMENVERTYIELSELYHWNRIECVENGEIKSIEEIHQEILKLVLEATN